MSRKDYIKAAKLIRTADLSADEWAKVMQLFTAFFSADNPRFDRDRFTAACVPNRGVGPLTR
jgi:uncharacterized protein YdaU (DUF1376 family)